MRISAEQVPFLHRVAPGYLKLITRSNFWPFMLITALMSLAEIGGFFLACEDLRRMLDNSFPACAFSFFKWRLARAH